jgi:hypothetical protein
LVKKVKKNEEKEITQEPVMTHIIEVKRPYTDKEIMAYSRNMADALSVMGAKGAELKAFASTIKGEIEGQEGILQDCAARVRAGYEMTSVACIVKYSGKIAIFTDKQTGEIIEKRELTEEEQLRLASQWKDAEEIIREDNEKNE